MGRCISQTGAIFGRDDFDIRSIREMARLTEAHLRGIVVYIFFIMVRGEDDELSLFRYIGSATKTQGGGARLIEPYERAL